MKRKSLSLKTKLAATLLQMRRPDATGKLVPVISFDEAKTMTADKILARFHFDHDPIPYAHGGPDEPWNLTPLPVADHRDKTANRDVPQIAKTKRITRKQEKFRQRMLAKDQGKPRSKGRIPSRPFQSRRGKDRPEWPGRGFR